MNCKIFGIIFLCLSHSTVYGQSSINAGENVNGLTKENLFAGGGFNLSFFNSRTILGVNPYIGYSINRWLDAAVSVNVNYISQRNYFADNDRVRQILVAPGAFVRLYPFKFLFTELQLERNFIKQKYIPAPGSVYSEEKISYGVTTLLAGVGYASDREYDDDEFYFVSVSFDLLNKPSSPYTSSRNNVLPVIKAGYNIKLYPVRHKRNTKH